MQQPVTSADPIHSPAGPLHIYWSAVFAGAIVAAGISFVLLAFGAGIGLSVLSPSPSWRNASMPLALLSGIWHLLISIAAFAVGGYLVGRMRGRLGPATPDEVEFRDGVHAAVMWGMAVIFTALLALAAARVLGPAYAEREASAPSSATSGAGEPRFVSYEVDRLLRGADRRPAADAVDNSEVRAEIGRALMAALDTSNYSGEDRAYLIRLVAVRTGIAPPEAERRVDTVVAQLRDKANRARRSAVLLAFLTAASLAVGLAVAWVAAGVGGRHRDGDVAPSLNWGRPTLTLR
jgi:hypothetical protein